MDLNEENTIIWENFINVLKSKIAMVSVNSWFKNCKIYKIEDATENNKPIKIITIESSSNFIRNEIKKRYTETIEELMESILGSPCSIKFIIPDIKLDFIPFINGVKVFSFFNIRRYNL